METKRGEHDGKTRSEGNRKEHDDNDDNDIDFLLTYGEIKRSIDGGTRCTNHHHLARRSKSIKWL